MKLFDLLLELLYPAKCPFCGRVLESWESGLCQRCQRELPWIREGEGAKPVDFCDQCLSPLWYRGRVPDAVQKYKFRGEQGCCVLFGQLMAQCLHDRWSEPADLITWVPLSAGRLSRRGYDQAKLLAEEAGRRAGLPVMPLLKKIRENGVQSRLSEDAARRANVQGAYSLLDGVDVVGRHVILVDDVTTSGATLSECAACLRLAGAASVVALTFARARK